MSAGDLVDLEGPSMGKPAKTCERRYMSVMEIGPVSGYIRWESEESLQMQLRSLVRWL